MSHTIKTGEKIVAVTRVQPPFTYDCVLDAKKVEECQYPGINFDIFRTLMTLLGLKYSIIDAEESTTAYQDKNGTWRGMLGQLYRGEANMTATLIAVRNQRLEITDFSAPVSYFISGFIIKAPKAINIMAVPSQFLFAPLQLNQWLLLLASMVTVSIVFVICSRVLSGTVTWGTVTNSIYDVVRSVFSQTHFFNPYIAPRILLGSFEIGLFFLISFYTSYLTSSLLVSVKPTDPFTGFDQFAQLVFDKKFTLITDDNPKKHIPITDKSDSSEPKKKIKIAYQWNPPVFVAKNDFDTIVEKIKNNDSLVYYGSYYHLLHGTSKSCDVKVVVDTYTHPTWLSFAFPKGSSLQNLISSALHRDYTTVDGYLARLYERYAKRRNCLAHRAGFGPSVYSSFGLWQMQGAFFVLINGVIMAVVVAIIEWFRHQFKKDRTDFTSRGSRIFRSREESLQPEQHTTRRRRITKGRIRWNKLF